MRRAAGILVLILGLWSLASAATTKPWCVIGWTAPADPDVASYRVYVSRVSGTYGAFTVEVTSPWVQSSCMDLGMTSGRYFMRVTAVDTSDNEGVPSAEMEVVVDVPVQVQP